MAPLQHHNHEHEHDDDDDVCEHVLEERREERRASISSAASHDSVSRGVLPPVPGLPALQRIPSIPGRRSMKQRRASTGAMRHGDANAAPTASPPAPLVCACGCHAHCPGPTTPGSYPLGPPVSPHTSPVARTHVPRASPIPEGTERDSDEMTESHQGSSRRGSEVAKEKIEMREQEARADAAAARDTPYAREGILRVLPKREAYDIEKQNGDMRTWHQWAEENVATTALVPALVMQALATGLLDATTYADFATFASNQTGNAILLTLAAVGTRKILLVLTGVSLGAFLLGAFVFGRLGHWFGVRRRSWLLVSMTLQTLMLVIACIFVSPHGPEPTLIGHAHEWVTVFLFAAMSGGQVAMARQSSCQELPTAPMTSTFVDFVADQYLFAPWGSAKAVSRNRRLCYVLAMIGGSFIGAVMHRFSSSWIVVLVSIGVKLFAFCLIALAEPDIKMA